MSTIAQHVESLNQRNRELFALSARPVRVQEVGSHYKAFFDGDGRSVTFGESPQHAIKRLKFWQKYGQA
jgi:hypothetical protein